MEEKYTSKVSSVFTRPIQSSPGGVLANLFRKLTIKLGYANKLKALCKDAHIRDMLYRKEQGRENQIDEKLEYRLLTMASDSKMTFDKFVTLISHLFNITDFKFTVSVKLKGSDTWISVDQASINVLGPDDNDTKDEEDGVIENAKQRSDRQRFEKGV